MKSQHAHQLVEKLWNFCNLLRDDGLSYGDYLEQLTYLLFLKMAHERTQPPFNQESRIPSGYDWPSLLERDGPELEAHYMLLLSSLGSEPGTLGLIFRKAMNRIQDPAKLRRLIVDLIDPEQWTGIDADIKGDAYEGLLEKNAADTKSGAGQYFTPRALIKTMVDVVQPRPGQLIADPCCGTGGFLLATHDYIARLHDLDRDQKRFLRDEALSGTEIVDNTARLCAMNLFLHNIGSTDPEADPPIQVQDALIEEPRGKVDLVLTNPPFGRQSSVTMVAEDGKVQNTNIQIQRQDFWATTSNKQLNFLQHVRSMLKIGGEAAIVLPDNVLFEGGAGETVRRRLFRECDVHTMLRLPTGIFYAQGVKANVLFFERRAPSSEPATKETWVYDFRNNQHFTLKTKALKRTDLDDFVESYKSGARHQRVKSERFRCWSYEELADRDAFNIDVWADVEDESAENAADLPAPEVLAEEIVEDLAAALEQFEEVVAVLNGGDGPKGDGGEGAMEELLPSPEDRI